MNKRVLLIICLIISGLGFSQSQNFRFRKLLNDAPDTPVAFAIQNDGASTLEYLAKAGIKMKYITREWIYVTMTPSGISEAQKRGDISQFYYEYAPAVALNDNDTSRMMHKVNEVQSGSGGLPAAYTGRNVIIGYIDQGLDFTHPDFKDANGHTRVLRYWDHTLPISSQTPQPYGYGQAWDSTDIATGVCTSTEQYPSAHGTTVAGAGSGNGLGNGKNKGMAPDSKIIIVETDLNMQNWTLTIADACDYIFKVADTLGLPAVINLSVGTYLGSHDGNDPASIMMEALLDEHPGRIIVSAAGNAGAQQKYHVRGQVDADTSYVWLKNNPSGALGANTIYFDLWSDLSDFQNVSYAFGADKPFPDYTFRGYSRFHPATEGIGSLIRDTIYSPGGNILATIQIYPEIVNGTYHMEVLMSQIDSTNYLFRFSTTGSGMYDMWSGQWLGANAFETSLPPASMKPDIIHYHAPDSLQSIVSSWNCSEKVISVGNSRNRLSHINNNGAPYVPSDMTPPGKLSPNSSKGPSRHDVVKPDITAGGDVALSPAPMWLLNSPSYNSVMEQGGMHARNGGTSMASPVVAGIAALFLEKCNTSTYQDFKHALTNNASQDQYTGSTPNFAYGYGKANALNTLLNSARIEGPETYCNTPTSLTAVAGSVVNSVVWSDNSTANPLIINQPGTYSVTVNYDGNCVGKATTVLPQGIVPATPLIAQNNNILTASTSANYQWYLNGQPIAGETGQSLEAGGAGSYTVSTTGPDGCIVFSAPVQYFTGLEEQELAGILVYPNPTSGQVEIKGLEASDVLRLSDIHGKNIQIDRTNEHSIDLSHVEHGVYFLLIARNSGQFCIKIVRN